jgi:hypothetical protein
MRQTIFIACLLLLALSFESCTDSAVALLQESGVEAEASIAFKRELNEKRKGRGTLTFTLYYFAKDSAALAQDKAQDHVLSDTSMSMLDRLDKWDPMGGGLGEFMSVDLVVPGHIFDSYNEGDKVKVLYLPNDPKVVRLKEQVEE